MQQRNTIQKSQLKSLIKEIVRGILKESITPLSGMEEMSGTGAASPVTGPMAFGKKKIREVGSPSLSVYPANYTEVSHYIRIRKKPSTGEFMVAWFSNGRFNGDKTYYTDDIGDAYDTFKAMQPQVDNANAMSGARTTDQPPLSEMTTTDSGTSGYNVPGAFARKGGSERGVAGSKKLGYTLTSIGKKDMEKSADKLLEGQGLGANFDKAQAKYDAQEPDDDCEDGHHWKQIRSDGDATLYRCKVCGKEEVS
jgi:hypothetical protein